MKLNYIFLGLLAVSAVTAAFLFSDPEKAREYAEMRRSVSFSPAAQDIILGVVVLVIGGYLAWSYLRKD
jgi:hypothetical protein